MKNINYLSIENIEAFINAYPRNVIATNFRSMLDEVSAGENYSMDDFEKEAMLVREAKTTPIDDIRQYREFFRL